MGNKLLKGFIIGLLFFWIVMALLMLTPLIREEFTWINVLLLIPKYIWEMVNLDEWSDILLNALMLIAPVSGAMIAAAQDRNIGMILLKSTLFWVGALVICVIIAFGMMVVDLFADGDIFEMAAVIIVGSCLLAPAGKVIEIIVEI